MIQSPPKYADFNIVTADVHQLRAWPEHEFNHGILASLSSSSSVGENLYSIANDNSVAPVITFCPRAFINGAAPNHGVTNVVNGSVPDNYQFYKLSGLQLSNYVNPKVNISDFGPFPSNMVARNSVFGPGSWNMDLGVYKNNRLSERFTLQIRFEAYNLFNHANFIVQAADVDTSSYNFVDGYFNGNRNVQLGAKLIF